MKITFKLAICDKCHRSLRKNRIPANALINHYCGIVPECLRNLTAIEEILLSQYQLKAKIFKIYGHYYESQLKIVGNVISFQQSMDQLLKCLPDTNQLKSIRVIFVGSKLKKSDLQRIFHVRKEKIKKALVWLQKNNPLYKDILIDEFEINKLPENDIPNDVIFDIIEKDLNNEESNNNLDNINLDDYIHLDKAEYQDFFTSVIINSNEPNEKDLKEQINDIIYVKRGKIPIQEFNNKNYLLGNYPCLYPYGIGSFSSFKIDKISFREYIVNKMLQSYPNFLENKTFMFCTFNILQRQESRIQKNLFCKRKNYLYLKSKIDELTIEKLANLKLDITQSKTLKSSSVEFKVLQQIFYGMSKVQGSKSALRDRRREIYSYMMYFGLPHFWITINPSDTNNPLFFFICGERIDSEYFKEANYKHRMKILAKYPFLQALFFQKLYSHFIEDILCYGRVNGLLGELMAYFVMIEAQGRGSLHGHGLFWLANMLCAEQLKLLIKTEWFYTKLINYLDHSIFCDLDNFEPFKNQENKDNNVLAETLDFLDNATPEVAKKLCLSKIYDIVEKTQIHKCKPNCFGTNNECKRGFGLKFQGIITIILIIILFKLFILFQ